MRNDPPAAPQLAVVEAENDTRTSEAPEAQSAEVQSPEVQNQETQGVEAVAALEPPVVETPDPVITEPEVLADTTSAAQPEASDVVAELLEPAEVGTLTGVDITRETPVLPNPQSLVPVVPDADAPVAIDTAPADPMPEDAPEIGADAPEVEAAPENDSQAPDVETTVDAAPVTQTPDALNAPEAGDTAQIVGTEAPAPLPDDAPEVETDVAPVTEVVTDTPLASTNGMPTGVAGVRVNSLFDNNTTVEGADATEDPDTSSEDAPAFERYAADAANPDNRPEVSVILIDDGSFGGAVSAVSGVSFPVTVMMNPSIPNATERMKAYRDAGIEVGVLAALPASATATDVEIFFEAAFTTLPETVAVLDAGVESLQADPEVMSQAIAALSDDGRGLVTMSSGLNTSLRAAQEQGVPTTLIYRNLDSEGQDARVIRRFMDQAAFRARQESGVVLLGQIRGETISALIQWGAANRASQVAMVPVSKVLQGD